jgi:hypothetical protein
MELHEMGLNGPARVVGIDPCPIIEPDDGTGRNVVTGTMAHPGANIVYLDITGLEEPLGVTDTHPIWSETRQDFVVAGQLEVGEQFRTVTGQSATLTKIHPHRGPPEMVFNLEVDGQHVYHVASSGLLVHNNCLGDLTPGEIAQIQSVVDAAGRPLEVVGSAAEGVRREIGSKLPFGKGPGTRSDIDYLIPPSSRQHFADFEDNLPDVDPLTGIIPGTHNPFIGPAIRFEPWMPPIFVPGGN